MLKGPEFLDIVSGKRKDLPAILYRGAFRAAAVPYAAAMRLRNWRYDAGHQAIHRVGVPVISVGNLTVGGTGKTPLIQWLARWFRERSLRVAVISRGYGAEAGGRNDEALDLERQLPDVPHLQNPDRVAAASTAIEEFDSQLLLLDDAFQHRRIHRDLDIVVIDAMQPFGFGHVLPRGVLREPLGNLRRAAVIAISRTALVSDGVLRAIHETVSQVAPRAQIVETNHSPLNWLSASGTRQPLKQLQGKRVAAFCGIGNPAGFRGTLQSCGSDPTEFRTFPDHHPYSQADIESITQWAEQAGVEAVVCTTKDSVKIQLDRLGKVPLYALEIGIQFADGSEVLEEQCDRLYREVVG